MSGVYTEETLRALNKNQISWGGEGLPSSIEDKDLEPTVCRNNGGRYRGMSSFEQTE